MFFTRYNWRKVSSVNTGESLTEQHHLETTNINRIVSTFNRTGRVISSNKRPPFFGDISNLPKDLLESHEVKLRAENAFRSLPLKVQERFGRDPEQLLAFVANPANRDEAVSLGLIDSIPSPVPAVPDSGRQERGDVAESLDI